MSESTNINPDDKAYYGCEKHHWGQDCPYCRIAELEAEIAELKSNPLMSYDFKTGSAMALSIQNSPTIREVMDVEIANARRAAFERAVEIATECCLTIPKSIGQQHARHHSAGIQRVINAIRKEMAQGEEIEP